MKRNGDGLERLTPSQRRVLNEVADGVKLTGIPPTIRELAAKLAIGTTAVRGHLLILERKQYVRCLPRKARGIIVLHEAS